VDDLLGHLARASVPLLALGVALHLAGQVLRGLAWRAALEPLRPHGGPSLKLPRVIACWVAGAGLSGVLSARGGDAVRVALVRRALPGVPIAALAGTIAVEGAFETVTGVVLGLWAAGAGLDSVDAGGTPWWPFAAGGALLFALGAHPRVNAWMRARGREARTGVALLGDPRRYARTVLPYSAASRAVRFASMASFLAAFALPTTLAAVAFLVTAQGSGRLVPAPGAAAGVGGTLLVVAFTAVTGREADPAALAALAIGVPALLTAIGVTLSLLLALAVLGTASPRKAWRELRGRAPAAPAAAPAR
jgi:hypothetical protein